MLRRLLFVGLATCIVTFTGGREAIAASGEDMVCCAHQGPNVTRRGQTAHLGLKYNAPIEAPVANIS